MLLGMYTNDKENIIQVNPPTYNRSNYSKVKYKFFLDAPFEISAKCCHIMKKSPVHKYARKTGRKPITAQMASESMLRTQQWLNNGCNGFQMKAPISNPMSFWTEQDVLWYIKIFNIPICSVYGDIVLDLDSDNTNKKKCKQCNECDSCEQDIEFKTNGEEVLSSGIFDEQRPLLKTTGCNRTGCMFCLFGAHLEKGEGRLERLKRTHPKQYEYIMKPKEQGGLGFKEVIDWTNEHGNLNIKY